jgi:hypothetical protein
MLQKKRLTLSPKEIEAEYGYLTGTLQAWRDLGKGPPFVKTGSLVKYRRDQFEAWLDSNTVRPQGGPPAVN